ncbi:sigma factor-like helix-turn-helix DNA-binding protein [Desulfofundulus kuznetsovii]|uniref:sigma factor-like helix-turn-helix DNA-binding protein n=1 Tax=Desulfofundulus kuznetsovii TaxID=58135 RepID=UPI00338D4889
MLERISRLSPQEIKVLTLRFGLSSGIRATQREVARKLGISRSYVSRIEKRALYKLIREMKKENPLHHRKFPVGVEEPLPKTGLKFRNGKLGWRKFHIGTTMLSWRTKGGWCMDDGD